tara:strand:- start:73940 stop:76534 length:2595 start_codon:yes stop_codon:yes gene_type:complete
MIYLINEFELDIELQELRCEGKSVSIQKKVFELLTFLIENRNTALTKDQIQDAVWPGTIVSETAITRAILKARRALNDDAAEQKLIKTVHGHGYRFVGEVIESEGDSVEYARHEMETERRADLIKVLAAYGAIAWLINQIAAMVWEAFEFDKFPLQVLLGVTLLGVPVSLGITWWYRFTEQGLRRRDELKWHRGTLSSKYSYLAIAGILVISLITTVAWQAREQPSSAVIGGLPVQMNSNINRIAMLPLVNATGDESYGWTRLGLMSLLNQKVAENGLAVVPSRSLIGLLGEVEDEVQLNDELLERLKSTQGASMVVAPFLFKDAGGLQLKLSILSGDGLQEVSVMDDVIPTELALLASAELIPRLNPPITAYKSGTSSDPFVNEIYARGLDEELSGNLEKARELFKVAVSQDPGFFLAQYEYAITTRYLGYFDEAEPLLDELVEQANQTNNPRYQVMLANARGVLKDLKGDMKQAELIYVEGLKIAESHHIFNYQADLLVNYAIIKKNRGELAAARELLGKAIAAYQKAELVVSGAVYNTLANIDVGEGDLVSAGKNYQRSLDSYRTQESLSGAAIALSNLSWLAQREHRFEESLALLTESANIRREIGDRVGLVKSMVREGAIYYEMGQFDLCLAIAEAILANEQSEIENDFKATALTYRGMVKAHQGDWTDAFEYLDTAIDIREARQDFAGVLRSQNLKVQALILKQDWAGAESLINRVRSRSQAINLKVPAMSARLNFADLLVQSGRPAEATRLYKELLQEVQSMSDSTLEKRVVLGYIMLLLNQGQADNASSLLDSLENSRPGRDLRLAQAELAFQMGNHKQAEQLMLQAKQLSYQRWTNANESSLARYRQERFANQGL